MTRAAVTSLTLVGFTAAGLLGAGGLDAYHLDVGVTILVYLSIAQAWNVLGGYAGQISLGTAAFVGSGGYASGLLLAHTGADWRVTVLFAAAVGAALALVVSVPLLRLRGDYFAIGTLAATIALDAVVRNWLWAGGSTGFSLPVDRIPQGIELFRLAVVVAALALAATLFVSRSHFGLCLTAIRDDEPAAAGLGVSVYVHRLVALVVSSVLAALAGVVVAFQSIAVSPDGMFSLLAWSLNALLMSIVGGAGTFFGPVAGVLIVYYGLINGLESTQTLSLILEGVLLVVIVRFAPFGVWPLLLRLGRLALGRARGRADPAPPSRAPAASDALDNAGSLETEII